MIKQQLSRNLFRKSLNRNIFICQKRTNIFDPNQGVDKSKFKRLKNSINKKMIYFILFNFYS
jgi:hypothetical protein